MKKKAIVILLIFALMAAVSGCREEPMVPGGLVQKAEVTYQRGDETVYRCYTHPEKISALLLTLRLSDFQGYAKENPERITGDRCRIELTRYDGSRGVILQHCNRFRSRDFHRWEKVDERQAEQLYPFLLHVPGDVIGTWGWTDTGRRYPAAV